MDRRFASTNTKNSQDLAGIADAERRQQRLDRGVLPFETVENEARKADLTLFDALRDRAAEAAQAWQAMGQSLDRRAGPDAPPTGKVRDLLAQIEGAAKRFAGTETANREEPAEPTPEPTAAAAVAASAAAPAAGGLASREDALRALAQIADFFRRTEPHSPLSYTLQEAVRRGRLTWPELLAEIVPDCRVARRDPVEPRHPSATRIRLPATVLNRVRARPGTDTDACRFP